MQRSPVTAAGEARYTERVRGRWTREQLAFGEALARARGATWADATRHMMAWYLGKGLDNWPPAQRDQEPSAEDVFRARETGLEIRDFMTTPTQGAAIRTAAGAWGVSEAELMRAAVDVYGRQGPHAQSARS